MLKLVKFSAFRVRWIGVFLAAALYLPAWGNLASGNEIASECPALPDISWWLSDPVKIASYIDTKHDGEWSKYIAKWERHLKNMQVLWVKDSVAVFKKAGVRLKGEKLGNYIADVKRRISALNCLARQAGAIDEQTERLGDFATAAGTPATGMIGGEPAPQSDPLEMITTRLMTPGSGLDLEIKTQCLEKVIEFRVINRGESWDSNATVSIHRVADRSQLSGRELRLRQDQEVSFRIKRPGKRDDVFGLRIDPSWHPRAFQYDSTVGCGPRAS